MSKERDALIKRVEKMAAVLEAAKKRARELGEQGEVTEESEEE